MTSIIKVDTLQDTGGNTILSSNGTGTFSTNFTTGKILQVVQTTLSTEGSTTSTSYVSTSLTASITPASTSNKIMVIVSAPIYQNTSAQDYLGTVYRGATDLGSTVPLFRARNNGSSISVNVHINYLDAPASSSSLTYTYYHKVTGGTGYVSINNYISTITLLEVSA